MTIKHNYEKIYLFVKLTQKSDIYFENAVYQSLSKLN